MKIDKLIRIDEIAKKRLEQVSKRSGIKVGQLASNAIKIALSNNVLKETLIKSVIQNLGD